MTERSVFTTPVADENIRAIDSWWRENRLASPDLFVSELALAVSLIGSFPHIGKRYHPPRIRTLRRYLLRATRYHIYYIESGIDELTILTVWGAVRGTTPTAFRVPPER
jgi:plasmid stabilization system protein ParE